MDELGVVVAEFDVMFVAVGKDVKKNKSVLFWALHNSKGKKICLVHVHVPAQMIPLPMGGKFPVSQVGEIELKAFRQQERQEMLRILNDYSRICSQDGERAEKLVIEAESIEEGIVKLISEHRIGRLVMGAAADNKYSRKMVKLKSRKAKYVCDHAPDFCRIWFVCNGHLIYTRKGAERPSRDVERTLSNTSDNVSDVGTPTSVTPISEWKPKSELSAFGGYEQSSAEVDQSHRLSSSSSTDSPQAVSAFSSPSSAFNEKGIVEKPGLELLALNNINNHHNSSPPSVLESRVSDDLYDRLEQAMAEAENSRREAFEESMRCAKAEKEAIEAVRKVKAAEKLYCEELKQRKYIEEALAKGKEELKNIKSQRDKVSLELREASDHKLLLESEIEKSNLAAKELEEKILSAVELLQKYKNEHHVLQTERDNALREAEELREELGPSSSHVPKYYHEFSFSDLEKATNCFDPSLIIGEGGFGSIYKGFLCNTEVAIKVPDPNTLQGPQEFQQEVVVLSKLRHPNLVTLIGACPESWALVYEYLRGGSLSDRLKCKDNTPPLSWQTRIRIATELCSVLIFLHSSHPSSIIHGDLKPANILLDEYFACKLSDFGICRVVSSEDRSMEQTKTLFTEPKGTFTYMDPEFLQSGELTTKSDVYSFGIILLRLLTGKPALGITREVQYALDKGNLNSILDPSAGDWPFIQAEQLANLALRCCDVSRKNRPDLSSDVWRVLESMKVSSGISARHLGAEDQVPSYFICPIFQEIMQDPQIAGDGYTYEAEAIKGWLDSGHDTSPMTNAQLTNHELIPNRALRSAIQEWIQSHNPL